MAPRPKYRLKPILTKTCTNCNKTFHTPNPRHLRCSKECALKWHRNVYIRYQWNYGMTLDDYNRMFEKQSGCCKICGRHQSEIKGKLNVDHCHKTDKVRSLLCNQCNQALGLVKENPKIIAKMLEYVL